MSVVTKTGDDGTTGLLFGVRVAKTDPRVEAVGAIDELNAALGLVRASDPAAETTQVIDRIQERLVGLMGEVGIRPEDAARYQEAGFAVLAAEHVTELEADVEALEEKGLNFDGWARPGAAGSLPAAHLDVARTVCRRAERRVLELGEAVANPLATVFLNRCSDLLWLMARDEESR